ncbi:MAG: hypothetical protein Q8P56_00925 [Candidatus Uhrbacteria bacterium]|nr:hypothetical protein [Candidatus Uhrbacteria bacterium]
MDKMADAIVERILYGADTKTIFAGARTFHNTGVTLTRKESGYVRSKLSYRVYASKMQIELDVIVWQMPDGSFCPQYASLGEQGHEEKVWRVSQEASGLFALQEIPRRVLRMEEGLGLEPPL